MPCHPTHKGACASNGDRLPSHQSTNDAVLVSTSQATADISLCSLQERAVAHGEPLADGR